MSEPKVFLLPDLGEGLTEAELLSWLVAVGDEIRVDQPIAEYERRSLERAAGCYVDRAAGQRVDARPGGVSGRERAEDGATRGGAAKRTVHGFPPPSRGV